MPTHAFVRLRRRAPNDVPDGPCAGLARRLRQTLPRLLAMLLFGAAHASLAQTFLENRPELVPSNFRSQRGVPLSSTVDSPAGSDGRAPTISQQSADNLPTTVPTAGQFKGALTFSGVIRPRSTNAIDTADFAVAATNLNLPRGLVGNTVSVVLRRAQVGAPYLGQQIAFLFGEVITVPSKNETNGPLSVAKENYWLPEPYTTNGHANAGYYWSQHAQRVFAVQPGPINITWQRATPTPGNFAGDTNYVSTTSGYYRLLTVRYLVSGSAVKEPRRMYWTEGTYAQVGKKITVPSARVNDVKVVYNSTFPERVTEAYKSEGEVNVVTTNMLQELRTLWFDKTLGVISAYNREGRVFVELLGNSRDGTAREHLGFEIVDVYREVTPDDVTTELGEIITAYPDGRPSGSLVPDPIPSNTGQSFTFRTSRGNASGGQVRYYATRETSNLNDFLVHWLQTGEAGLQWPAQFSRYRFVWPSDPAKYSHFVRPQAATEEEAKATAVPLPTENAPIIDYQDQFDGPRAKLTDDFRFYTFLNATYPAHRTLLRFSASDQVAFERVFSWLDTNLRTTNFNGTVATNLAGWNTNTASQTVIGPDTLVAPRVFQQSVEVGQRITAPDSEAASTTGLDYLAGYIRQSEGTSYSVTAYIDPFISGFSEAQQGSIIPVNSLANAGRLEVWWFRPNTAMQAAGIKAVYWPSVIGRYTINWPAAPSEIVLASNDGSGGLPSLQASGHIYFQNDPALPGYNPNEEHALMQGGQAYALRDDLNVTNSPGFTSQPFVLLEYTESDGRPAMRPFKVLREKGDIRFDYRVTAGTVLQPPMPLPLLDKPFAPAIAGSPRRSLNSEFDSATVLGIGGTPVALTLYLQEQPTFKPCNPLVLQDVSTTNVLTRWFLPDTVNFEARSLTGVFSTNAPYLLTYPAGLSQPANPNHIKFVINSTAGLAPGDSVVIANTIDPRANNFLLVSTNLESGLATIVADYGTTRPAYLTNSTVLVRIAAAFDVNLFSPTWRLSSVRRPEDITDANYGEFLSYFTFQDRKGNAWVYRGPNNEGSLDYISMQFYYKTQAGFHFPAYGTNQPPVGTITPYLRSLAPNGTSYVGNDRFGNADNDQHADGNALPILYRPAWPDNAPVLNMGETLTLPKRGLPAVRGQSSLQVLYQQSQAARRGDINRTSVLLHDPTREKTYNLGSLGIPLTRIPDGVKQQAYGGKTYFPNLPPHLAERFFLDPNRGPTGALVFKGQFVDAPVGDDYLLPNTIGPQDAGYLTALCPTGDPYKPAWNQAVTNGLKTIAIKYIENPARPGTYIPSPDQRTAGPGEVVKVWDQDVAVDSYALSAVGPGTGYVTLLAGNGRAFTNPDEPVSLHVIKVVDRLYRGELKPILSSNPLNEKATLQQVVDLAGAASQYEFDWLIASPVDGAPPVVYQNTRELLLGDGTWKHVRFPLASDSIPAIASTPAARYAQDVSTAVVPVSSVPFTAVSGGGIYTFDVPASPPHLLVPATRLTLQDSDGLQADVVVTSVDTTNVVVELTANQTNPIGPGFLPVLIREAAAPTTPQSIVFREFTIPATNVYSQLWLSLDLDAALGAQVYLDGQLLVVANQAAGNTPTATPPATLFPLPLAYSLGPEFLSAGELQANGTVKHVLAVALNASAAPDAALTFNARLEGFRAADQTGAVGSPWVRLDSTRFKDGVRVTLGDSADVRSLADNYVIMRYRATNTTHAAYASGWSQWTEAQLVEGWIKRVLAGINPFNQRVNDLFNHRVNTDVSLITQAGPRWEGDVALNLSTINNFGLIEIYETILRRGRGLSIDAGINYGPANDALLLAAGYLNDLYLMLGNEASDDAANPTISIGSKDSNYGDVATALFAFKGQTASLLEEELSLLRGRDDFLQPGVQTAPVYNRLFWNYTRGIDAGEVVYALNYNIKENNDTGVNGVIDADDARRMYPQGHGDAYGHYLTALTGYYSLLLDNNFDWVPRSEAVTVLGKAVQVDYQDERKFAAAAAAAARAGRQIFDLTWRQNYVPGDDSGWEGFGATRDNLKRSIPTTRYWGTDHWATRTMIGAYVHWVAGNAIVPAEDPDPSHEGIQKIERDTVPELSELAILAGDLQTSVENAEAHLSPIGLPEGSLAFDVNPSLITGDNPRPHFEQIYDRAKVALNNALAAFDDAKDVTRQLRAEQDSLSDLQSQVSQQELAYQYSLIELYGSPYPEDIGPGELYETGYTGPDFLHFMYVDNVQLSFPGLVEPGATNQFKIDIQKRTSAFDGSTKAYIDFLVQAYASDRSRELGQSGYTTNLYVTYDLEPHRFFDKPSDWTGRRASPGRLQDAIGRIMLAHNALYAALNGSKQKKYELDRRLDLFQAKLNYEYDLHRWDVARASILTAVDSVVFAGKMLVLGNNTFSDGLDTAAKTALEAIPKSMIVGTAVGGDTLSAARGAILGSFGLAKAANDGFNFAKELVTGAFDVAQRSYVRIQDATVFGPMARALDNKAVVVDLETQLIDLQNSLFTINQRFQELDDAQRNLQSLLAQGNRILAEREIFRQRSAALVQGYRTRDAGYRIFRNEKLERYKTLFDLAARYAFLAANAYDYETGLLNTPAGKAFISRIVNARALGVVRHGEPQYAGSNTGDPGLSSVLAEMKADWDVLKGRLGFNNPDAYGTTVSLRTENFRTLPGPDGDQTWKDILSQARRENLLDDEDVRRYCMQIDPGNGLPVPGLVITFQTTIGDTVNLFGRTRAAGDHWYSPSSFATKIFGAGIAFEGYKGMDDPTANSSAVAATGATSPPEPSNSFLSESALGATPYVYLVPVGLDSMRSPPLGDISSVRTWNVNDVTIPLPFNIGASDLSSRKLWQSSDSLTELLFGIRKHQAFRPVSTAAAFSSSIFSSTGQLQRSQFTNARLIGRSVWNSQWKLVIPGRELLSDPNQGLDRFIQTVKDIKLHFVTYSYSGN